jgi:hypothetical protein
MTEPHLTDELRATMSADSVAPLVAAMVAPESCLNGQTWLAGAGWMRRASAVEWGVGAPVGDAAGRGVDELVAQEPPREFDDALAAHADFLASARQGLRARSRGE